MCEGPLVHVEPLPYAERLAPREPGDIDLVVIHCTELPDLATAMKQDDFLKVQEYIKLGDARLQGILVAIRAWNAGKSNPLSTVQLAMREQDIDHDLIGGGDA